jgi:hypothetical protein
MLSNLSFLSTSRRVNNAKPLRVACVGFNEAWLSTLAQTGHELLAVGMESWNTTIRPQPTNVIRVNPQALPPPVDLVMVQVMYSQAPMALHIAVQHNAPILRVFIDTVIVPGEYVDQMAKFPHHASICTSQAARGAWMDDGQVIARPLEQYFLGEFPDVSRNNGIMTVVGQMERQSPPYLGSIVAGHKYHTIGLGVRPIPTEQFPVVYKSAQILLDLTTVGQSPASVLEAMAIGLPVVTINPNIFDNIIVNGTTGFACYNEGDAKEAIDRLMNDAELSERIARQAKQVVLERHSTVIQWKKAMEDASSISTGLWRDRDKATNMIVVPSATPKTISDAPRPLNILTIPTHERYETQLAKTGHNFFAIQNRGLKQWNTAFAPMPHNYRLLSAGPIAEQLSQCPPIDLVLCQHKYAHWQILAPIAKMLGCPLVSMEYTTTHSGFKNEFIEHLGRLRGDLDVFVCEDNATKWQFDLADPSVRIVHHGTDTELFSGWSGGGKILTVMNDYINRDAFCGYTLFRQVTHGLPVSPIGATPGLSVAARDIIDLVEQYRSCGVFLNTTLASPVPTALLEAMSCLPSGEMVFYDYYPMKVEDVLPLQTANQTLLGNRINKKISQQYSGQLCSIKASHIPVFRATSNHPVAVAEMVNRYDSARRKARKHAITREVGDIQYKPADQVCVGDYLVVPKFKQQIPMGISKEWLRFYGLYVADGSATNGYIQFTFHEHEMALGEEVRRFAASIGCACGIYPVKGEKAIRVNFYHGPLARELLRMFHGGGDKKNLPKELMLMSEEETSHFLSGYIDGDGYRCKDRRGHHSDKYRLTYSTVSVGLAYQMFLLYTKIDQLPSWHCTGPRRATIKGREFDCLPRYQISVSPKRNASKKDYLEDSRNFYIAVKTTSTRPYNGTVYNFNTETGTYSVPFAQTHNCGAPVVSTATCAIPTIIIEDGVNGFATNDPATMRQHLVDILANPDLAKRLGQAARDTVLAKFSEPVFLEKWNNIFNEAMQTDVRTTNPNTLLWRQ